VKSFRTRRFKELFESLPREIQDSARKAFRLWLADPRHPSLHFKPIRSDVWSVRVTHDYRALGVLLNGDIYWNWIGRHDEYERIIGKL
jgi:hypothetical protein